LASGGDDGRVHLWAIPNGTLQRTLEPHRGPVTGLAFSPSDRQLATGGTADPVRLWSLRTGRCTRTFDPAESGVWAFVIAKDGKRLVVYHGVVRTWDLARDRVCHQVQLQPDNPYFSLYHLMSAAISPDCRILVTGHGYIGWEKGCLTDFESVHFWDAKTGALRRKLAPTSPIDMLAFSQDGKFLATASGHDCELGARGSVWTVKDGKAKGQFNLGSATALAFAPDGTLLAIGGTAAALGFVYQLLLWDVKRQATLVTCAAPCFIRALGFSRDGMMLAAAGDDTIVRLWSLKDRQTGPSV
jgi:WD40 repeat protein